MKSRVYFQVVGALVFAVLLGPAILLSITKLLPKPIGIQSHTCTSYCKPANGPIIRDSYFPIIGDGAEIQEDATHIKVAPSTYIIKYSAGAYAYMAHNDEWLSNPDFAKQYPIEPLEPVGYFEAGLGDIPVATLIIFFFWGIGLLQMYLETRKARKNSKP